MSAKLQWRPLQLQSTPGASLLCQARPMTKRAAKTATDSPPKASTTADTANQTRKSSTVAAAAVSSTETPKPDTRKPRKTKATNAKDIESDDGMFQTQSIAESFAIQEPHMEESQSEALQTEFASVMDTNTPEAMEVSSTKYWTSASDFLGVAGPNFWDCSYWSNIHCVPAMSVIFSVFVQMIIQSHPTPGKAQVLLTAVSCLHSCLVCGAVTYHATTRAPLRIEHCAARLSEYKHQICSLCSLCK